MQVGFWQIILVLVIAFLLFGRGRVSDLMGDVAKGIKNFKKGLNEDDDTKIIDAKSSEPSQTTDKTKVS